MYFRRSDKSKPDDISPLESESEAPGPKDLQAIPWKQKDPKP